MRRISSSKKTIGVMTIILCILLSLTVISGAGCNGGGGGGGGGTGLIDPPGPPQD